MRPSQARHLCARSLAVSLGIVWLASAAVALAQPPLTLPQPSQAASAGQRVGLTDITVTYHRPAVNKREIWGKLVPYGQVWRAGANENTVITFSTPVSVGGHALPAGSYGLHMIPAEREWTVIFNRESKAWGSFFYDQADDAARVTVTPSAARSRSTSPTRSTMSPTSRWWRRSTGRRSPCRSGSTSTRRR